jgi:hypothetical protein
MLSVRLISCGAQLMEFATSTHTSLAAAATRP